MKFQLNSSIELSDSEGSEGRNGESKAHHSSCGTRDPSLENPDSFSHTHRQSTPNVLQNKSLTKSGPLLLMLMEVSEIAI